VEVIENKILALGPHVNSLVVKRESRATHVWSRRPRRWRGSDSRVARGGDADSSEARAESRGGGADSRSTRGGS
jgi:hypothetical protein